ncbi:SDR family oxidoreductase [Yoonia litorea]|uniref:Gluconate 5-dehydrogenase/2,3-dihydro-2,3-dihydroxybenzoate dehydrogenase n=1 Tax=Yoonia litorea TaxID=1123755 RepID=A0A1I6MXF5_9RHOB|nr:SDR family oxidoreductase [Yoonia litorea]SFS20238.1 gluconate 5-dehydrogenase/2,3-dihydro-2,3-dihydroxybenzoate dehydrogenase [Yoonia litorea]
MAKRVFLTAGAGGIGRVIADSFLAEGAQVWTCDADESAVDRLPEGISGATVNVTLPDQLDEWLKAGIAKLGGCDVLINNAGIAGQAAPVEELDLDEWRTCLAVNLDAQMLTCKAIAPHMKRQRRGAIINLSSTSGLFGVPFRAPYVAAKWAVIGLTKTLAAELGPHGIRCNAVCPGAVEGDRMDRVLKAEADARGTTVEDVYHDYAGGTSMRRFATPDEIARLCQFLASDAAAFISGQAIAVDGNTETYHSV